MFKWLKARKRKAALARPFPRPWQELLHDRIWQYRNLTELQRDKLHDCIKVIVTEISWEGCDGLIVSDDKRVTIAGHAGLMLLGTNDYFFDGVRTILLYPHAFDRQTRNEGLSDTERRGGEAWQNGPIVLSWNNVMMAGNQSGTAYNIVVHEFAHHLDGLDGEMGGTPIFDNTTDHQEWLTVMGQEFADLKSAADSGRRTVLNHYGAKSKAEFFAVATECFFENPRALHQAHAELYQLLRRFYRIDTIDWECIDTPFDQSST